MASCGLGGLGALAGLWVSPALTGGGLPSEHQGLHFFSSRNTEFVYLLRLHVFHLCLFVPPSGTFFSTKIPGACFVTLLYDLTSSFSFPGAGPAHPRSTPFSFHGSSSLCHHCRDGLHLLQNFPLVPCMVSISLRLSPLYFSGSFPFCCRLSEIHERTTQDTGYLKD